MNYTFDPWQIVRGNWVGVHSVNEQGRYNYWNLGFWIVLLGGIWVW